MKKAFILLIMMASSASYAATHQIGVGLGVANTDGPNNWSSTADFISKIDYAYQFHPNLAVEVGYANLEAGSSSVSALLNLLGNKQVVDYSTGYTGLKASVSPLSFLNLYAVGGANYSSVKQTYTPRGGTEITDTHRGLHPYYGVGTEVVIFNTVGLGVEYRKFFLANDFESDAVFAGMNIKF
ncbi:porin family protein [Vibrio sp. S4M6]|uniref:outer membrane beta-barrel protein n=1 Tax=Vibrio sinus TaxID=2946865 RepID=UPI00202A7AEF|nr:outer membrane beta-barrel protein [Vibrio sinus]MCL9780710.1 porin family protein [Vibrio sinus]